MKYLLALALLLGGATAHSTPVANLVLACPDNNAVGQAFDSCRGYVYQIPTNQLIVVSGPSYIWRRAGDLAGSDTLSVCTLPVEPGQYSSCRDAAGNRRTAFVRKDSVITGGRNSVTVSKSGGDYTDPVTAAANAFAGDTWCVAPQWPQQPCVMAIGEGIFILQQTLAIPEGLAVSGSGKGTTMLVADNGIEMAVSSFGNVRISDLTIVNTQTGGARTTGLDARGPDSGLAVTELRDVAIHVAGAAQNVAILKNVSVEILDSEVTAVGQDTTGIFGDLGPSDGGSSVTLERSRVSAEKALHDPYTCCGVMRLVDSHISGGVYYNREGFGLAIIRSAIAGYVSARNDHVAVDITDSSINGGVGVGSDGSGGAIVRITNTYVEGRLSSTHANGTFDGLTVHGDVVLFAAGYKILRSYIINPASNAPALSLREGTSVQIEQTFVQGSLAVAAEAKASLRAASSVLAGPVSSSVDATISCTDTFGADYELLSASCQPQVP